MDRATFLALAEQYDEAPIEEIWRGIVNDVKDEYLDESQRFPWIVGFSGGKDSTVVTHAVFEALLDILPSKRSRPVHIVSNDTRVESPLVMGHLDDVSRRIAGAAFDLGLPITVARTHPDEDKTFWVLLIGKGYGVDEAKPFSHRMVKSEPAGYDQQQTQTYAADNPHLFVIRAGGN